MIFNVSNRFYDYSKFKGKVKDYEWPDHQAPALTTLIDVAFEMQAFLKSKHLDKFRGPERSCGYSLQPW